MSHSNTPSCRALPGAAQRASTGGYVRAMEVSEGRNFRAAKRKREVDVIVIDDDEPVVECAGHGHETVLLGLRQRENALDRREHMATRFETRLREWDDRLGVTQQDISSREDSLAAREEGVSHREEKIGVQEEEVEQRERQVDRREDSLRNWRNELREWDHELKRRDEDTGRLKHKLRQWENALREWRDQLDNQRDSMRELMQQVEQRKCVVCLDRDVGNFILRCGHRPLCRPCLDELIQQQRAPQVQHQAEFEDQVKCPLCRVKSKPITMYC